MGFTLNNIKTYLEKADLYQAIHFIDTLQIWADYLRIVKLMGVEMPKYLKSLKKQHDLLTRDFKNIENKIYEKIIKN